MLIMNDTDLNQNAKEIIWDAALQLYGKPPVLELPQLVSSVKTAYLSLFADAENQQRSDEG